MPVDANEIQSQRGTARGGETAATPGTIRHPGNRGGKPEHPRPTVIHGWVANGLAVCRVFTSRGIHFQGSTPFSPNTAMPITPTFLASP